MRLTKGLREYLSRMLELYIKHKLTIHEIVQFAEDAYKSGYINELPSDIKEQLYQDLLDIRSMN